MRGIASENAAGQLTDIPLRLLVELGPTGFAEGDVRSVHAATGARFDFPFVMVIEMKDGKVARLTEYFDTHPLKTGPKPELEGRV